MAAPPAVRSGRGVPAGARQEAEPCGAATATAPPSASALGGREAARVAAGGRQRACTHARDRVRRPPARSRKKSWYPSGLRGLAGADERDLTEQKTPGGASGGVCPPAAPAACQSTRPLPPLPLPPLERLSRTRGAWMHTAAERGGSDWIGALGDGGDFKGGKGEGGERV
jgi:hypothetical protein